MSVWYNNIRTFYLERITKLTIRSAASGDLDRIMEIYDIAKAFMKATGNPNQWPGAYPAREDLERDIDRSVCYVLEDTGVVHAVFVCIVGPEHDYEDGTIVEGPGWINDEPYGTIHRVASDGRLRSVLHEVVGFCRGLCPNLRIDTHRDNKVMQHCIAREGFVPCGLLLRPDGEYRLAFQQVFLQ